MKTFFLTMSTAFGFLAIWTGSPWYLLPQFTALAGWAFIIGVEIYDEMTREKGRK